MAGFTKLWSDILTSSIWNENNITRIVWITLLAMSNADGYVSGVPTSVAVLARVQIDDCKKALERLSSPDEESRTKKADGRRIEAVDGGWIILNYPEHRARLSDDQKAINARERQRKHREKDTKCDKNCDVTEKDVTQRDSASASASDSASEDKRNKELTTYSPISQTLAEIVQTNKCITISTAQKKSWSSHLRLLETVNKVSKERMTSALTFYAEHVGEEYMPVIESGKIFRQKFTKLEDAMKRLDYKPPAPAETDQAILDYAKEFNRIGGFSAELEDVDRIRVVVEDNCGGSKGWTRVIKAAKQLKTKRMIDYE